MYVITHRSRRIILLPERVAPPSHLHPGGHVTQRGVAGPPRPRGGVDGNVPDDEIGVLRSDLCSSQSVVAFCERSGRAHFSEEEKTTAFWEALQIAKKETFTFVVKFGGREGTCM